MHLVPRTRLFAALAAALCLGTTAARSGDEPMDDAAAESSLAAEAQKAFGDVRPKLEALAQWCEEQKLFIERSTVAESILGLDPENAKARAWLKWKRQKDGTWKQTTSKQAFDDNPGALPEWKKRHDELDASLRKALQPFLDRKDLWNSAGTRDRVLRTLVAFDPDDAALRDANGETLVAGKWLLKESAAAAAGRKRILSLALDADIEALKRAKTLTAGIDPEFTACIVTPDFTLKSRLPVVDSQEIAARVIAARTLFERVLETRTRFHGGFTIYVFATSDEAARWADTRTDLPEERRKDAHRFTTLWLNTTEVVLAKDNHDERIDACVRQVLSALEGDAEQLMAAPGWMGEGFGMYLTHALVGTRLTAFVQPTKYADDTLTRDLSDAKSDWVNAVRRMVVEKSVAPNLPVLTGLPINSMGKDDGLMAYALSAYFLEGRPKDALAILSALKEGCKLHEALARTCGVDAEGLEVRFVRWLRETK